MVSTKYICIRCNYSTKDKSCMRDHLYNRKTVCGTIINDIELTDEIKEHIINYKVYHIPKVIKTKNTVIKEERKDLSITVNVDLCHNYIYLLRAKENVRHKENIYKIGKTVTKELTLNLTRLISYGKGSELILIRKCIDSSKLEQKILKIFKKKFHKHIYGNEYFAGDYNEMCTIISNIVNEEYESNKINLAIETRERSKSI